MPLEFAHLVAETQADKSRSKLNFSNSKYSAGSAVSLSSAPAYEGKFLKPTKEAGGGA